MNYSIIPLKDFLKIRKEKYKEKTRYQLEFNRAIVYPLIDGRVVLVPQKSFEVMLFVTKEDMEDYFKNSKLIPIKERLSNVFIRKQELIVNFPDNLDKVLDLLSNKIDVSLSLNTSKDYLNSLDVSIVKSMNKLDNNENTEELWFLLGMYIGELIRIKKNASWKLDKKYSVNPYLKPNLYSADNKRYNLWRPTMLMVTGKRKASLVYLVKMICLFRGGFFDKESCK